MPNTEYIEMLATALQAQANALESLETVKYVEIENSKEFQKYTERNLQLVIADLQEIVNALWNTKEDLENPPSVADINPCLTPAPFLDIV